MVAPEEWYRPTPEAFRRPMPLSARVLTLPSLEDAGTASPGVPHAVLAALDPDRRLAYFVKSDEPGSSERPRSQVYCVEAGAA
jgi:hypothetical protein